MNPIPWLKSPVAISAVVAILSGILVLLGKQDLISIEALSKGVETVFQTIALIASGWTLVARARSKLQPLTLTQASADRKAIQSPIMIGLMAMLVAVCVASVSGCGTLAIGRAQTIEQRAAALLGDFTLYQRASIALGEDTTVAPEARRAVLDAVIVAKPVADSLDQTLRQYRDVKRALDAGSTTDQKLAIAASNLQSWIQQLTPLITSLRSQVEGASP